mgnify:CR=1 FL=1
MKKGTSKGKHQAYTAVFKAVYDTWCNFEELGGRLGLFADRIHLKHNKSHFPRDLFDEKQNGLTATYKIIEVPIPRRLQVPRLGPLVSLRF